MLGIRIAILRISKGWSQAELAQRIGVSASTVGMYEQGRREPSLGLLVRLAQELGATTDYLLMGETPDANQSAAPELPPPNCPYCSVVSASESHDEIITRQPNRLGWRLFVIGLPALEACPFHFPIVSPIQTLAAAVAVGHKLPVQKALTPRTTVTNVIHRKMGKYSGIFHLHGHAICHQQLKKDRKISQSAGFCLLSDCPYCMYVFLYLFLLSCGSANFRDTRGHQHFLHLLSCMSIKGEALEA